MQDRKFLSHLILSAMLILGSGQAFSQADSYPARTITMIVPTAPGGTTDISARMLATPLGAALGQTIVVENKGGGNGNIAASQVKSSSRWLYDHDAIFWVSRNYPACVKAAAMGAKRFSGSCERDLSPPNYCDPGGSTL